MSFQRVAFYATKPCFLLSRRVIPSCVGVDVLNCSRFISSATTALAVIELSLLLTDGSFHH